MPAASESGACVVADLTAPVHARVRNLVDLCADADIRFVDAAVLAVVERLGESMLAPLDRRHLRFLRPRHRGSIELQPA